MALRFDIAKLEQPKIDHNGYLQADAVLTRTGVFTYRKADGTVTRELRHPDDVFKEDSLATLKHRPFTDRHPIIGEVNAKNTRQLARGMVISRAKQDGELVRSSVLVTDQPVIDKIMREDNPVREVSCGYKTDVVEESGTFNGERYDHRQTNIVYNHVALVPRGRAGPVARLRVDAEAGAEDGLELKLKEDYEETDKQIILRIANDEAEDTTTLTAGTAGVGAVLTHADASEQEFVSRCMGDPQKVSEFPDEKQRAAVCFDKFRRGDEALVRFEFDKAAGWDVKQATQWLESQRDDHDYREDHAMTIKIQRDAVATQTFKQDAFVVVVNDEEGEKSVQPALEKLDAAIVHIKKLEGEKSQLQGRVDELVEKAELPPERLSQLGQERADIMGVAHHVGLENIENLKNDEVKKMVVHKVNPKLNLDGDDMDQKYINGRYDSIVENIKKNNKALKSLSQLRQITRSDDYKEDGEQDDRTPREKFAQDTSDMWMTEAERKQLHG